MMGCLEGSMADKSGFKIIFAKDFIFSIEDSLICCFTG
jgi:hypothetical protein